MRKKLRKLKFNVLFYFLVFTAIIIACLWLFQVFFLESHYQKVKGIKTALKDRELQMIVDSAQDISLELGLLKDKVAFFEEVFGIRLVLRRKGRA